MKLGRIRGPFRTMAALDTAKRGPESWYLTRRDARGRSHVVAHYRFEDRSLPRPQVDQ